MKNSTGDNAMRNQAYETPELEMISLPEDIVTVSQPTLEEDLLP